MRRRAALSVLLGAAGAAALPGHGRERASAEVLAWGPAGLWVGREGSDAWQSLPGLGAATADPVPAAGAVWGAARPAHVVCWRRGADAAWGVAAQRELDAPVHALAASGDGAFALAAHGEQLSLLDAQGHVLRRWTGSDLARRQRGRATVLRHLSQRRSFVVAWAGLGELWEIALDPAAEPIHDGLVHDYRMGEAIAAAGFLGVRRTPLERPMPELGFTDARVPWVAGIVDGEVEVVHLDVRRRIARWPLPGAAPAASLLRVEDGQRVWWLPAGRELHRFDTTRWQRLGHERMPGTVRVLQALDDAVWALTGDGDEGALSVWRAGRWRPVREVAGEALALAADSVGRRLLLARARSPQLLVLDESGELRQAWSLPSGAALHGARWLPPAP